MLQDIKGQLVVPRIGTKQGEAAFSVFVSQ